MELAHVVCLDAFFQDYETGSQRTKKKMSPDQITVKPCNHITGQMSDQIFTKAAENVNMLVSIVSGMNLKLCHIQWFKTNWHKCKSRVKTGGQTFNQILIRKFVLMISRISSNLSHVWSKTRSPVQISGKPCQHSKKLLTFLNLFQHLSTIQYAPRFGKSYPSSLQPFNFVSVNLLIYYFGNTVLYTCILP